MGKIAWLGKGPGFVIVAIIIVVGLLVLSYTGKDVAALTGPLGAFVAAFYGAGFAKSAIDKYAEVKKNGQK
jgi:hypothetical protein